MRLNTYLQQCNLGARRRCDRMIREGHVSINGEVILNPGIRVNPATDKVYVDQVLQILKDDKHDYFMLNKPLGYVCSTRSRQAVLDLLPQSPRRLFTVGRLDRLTSGLLLITSDGQFCQDITHPSKKIPKEYIAKVDQWVTDMHLKTMSKGCEVQGVFVKPNLVRKIRKNTVKIVVHEGRKHEVRQIIDSAGLKTIELKRVRIGGLQLGSLPIGQYKLLKPGDLAAIFGKDYSKNLF